MSRKINILMVLAVVLTTNNVFAKKSVFIISKHLSPSKVQAYSIDGNEITLQADIDIGSYNPPKGAVANAVWPEKELMFITYEYSDMIVWSSTKRMEKVGEYDTNKYSLAGIVVDTEKELIYTIRRGLEDLYVYSFDDVNNTLVFEDSIELEPSGSSIDPWWGMALDEDNDRLYLTDTSRRVHYYNTNTWARINDDIDIVVDGYDRKAISIAVDTVRGYMYTGYFNGQTIFHNYLVRTELSSPHNSIEVLVVNDSNVGKPAIGIGVDEDTGYVYVTTKVEDFRVYDSDLNLLDDVSNAGIYQPAGVAVGGFYKKPSFDIVKDNNDPNDDCVRPFVGMGFGDNYLDYKICWDANGYADSNVVVVDYLPDEVDYYSSEPNGDYDPDANTVTWDLNDIIASDEGCIILTTKVNGWARPGMSFSNYVVMEGDTYMYDDTFDVNVCCWWAGDGNEGIIIYVDKDANGFDNGTSWDNAYNYLQDALAGAQKCGSAVTAIWVAGGIYKPTWDAEEMDGFESFELLEGVGLFGHFGGVGTYETSISQRDFSEPNNETILDGEIGEGLYKHVYYVLYGEDVEDVIIDGFTIINAYDCGVYFDDCDGSVVNCKIKDNAYGINCDNYSEPDIHNCFFAGNPDGSLYITLYSYPEISYCTFDGNDTTSDGIHIRNSVVVVENSVFKDHTDNGIEGINGTLTVTNCDFSGDNDNAIEISDITTIVSDCSIKNCGDDGIYAYNSDLIIDHTVISNSSDNALYTTVGCNLTLKNSVVRESGESGLELHGNYETTIKNNWIHDNGKDESANYGGAGIWFTNQVSVPLVRNNTIYNNYTYGIESSEQGADPNIINCIIYGNDSDLYRENDTFDTVNYCDLQSDHNGIGNITSDPCFMNILADANDLHIDELSKCKNKGDPNGSYGSETDIDGEDRVKYGRVDIGADEYYWSASDFDESGIVNFLDYAVIAGDWMTDDNDVNYVDTCDLVDNNSIDYNDLGLFCDEWLWESPVIGGWMMSMGGGGYSEMSMMESLGLEVASVTSEGGGLMLSGIDSLEMMPERLAARCQKFYDVKAEPVVSGRRELEVVDVDEMIAWLDAIWEEGGLKSYMKKKEYLAFREALENFWR